MKKKNRLYIVAGCFIAAGILTTGVGIAAGGWPGVSLSSRGVHTTGGQHQNEPYILEKTELDEFDNITINIDYADLEIIPSDGYYLEYQLSGSQGKPVYETKEGTFLFSEDPNNARRTFFNFSFGNFGNWGWSDEADRAYYVRLYMPEDKIYDTVNIYNDSGSTKARNLKARNISLKMDYGDIEADTIKSEKLSIYTDSGDVQANTVTAGTFELENDYGSVDIQELKASKAEMELESGNASVKKNTVEDLSISSSYGDVKLGDATITKGNIQIDSGKLDITEAALGKFKVDSEYGDVDIQLKDDPASYAMKIKTEYGSVNVPFDGRYISDSDEERFEMSGSTDKILEVSCDSGDITISSSKGSTGL